MFLVVYANSGNGLYSYLRSDGISIFMMGGFPFFDCDGLAFSRTFSRWGKVDEFSILLLRLYFISIFEAIDDLYYFSSASSAFYVAIDVMV